MFRLPLLLLSGWLCLIHTMGLQAALQGIDPTDRPIADIRIIGLDQVAEQLVLNQVRMAVGQPYDPQVVEEDIIRITHLGRFSSVRAEVQPKEDGSIILKYIIEEQLLLSDVQVVGNKAISDGELLGRVLLHAGDPVDTFLIDRGRQQIIEAYEEKGYFVADVTIDQKLLDESGILIFRVREGPRVRIREIRFEGNQMFSTGELRSKLRSKTYFPILQSGDLNREQLELDAARVRDHYQQRGYLDAQVGRRIDLSPDQKDAVVTFLIKEGPQYTVDRIEIEGALIFPDRQLQLNMELAGGEVFSVDKLAASRESILDMYGKLGFLEADVRIERIFHEGEPKVDLLVQIDEGEPYLVGKVMVRGNELTQSKVILRQVRGMIPGRPFDRSGVDQTRRRLQESPLFSEGTVTVLGDPNEAVRDVLIEVKEKNTGSISFGAGISSDAGVVGAIDLVQRNFDITRPPDDFEDILSGRAFRGAGQYFSLSLQPGTETSRYAVSFREPYMFETNYFLDSQAFFFQRERDKYDERRLGGRFGVGQRFGDVWSASIVPRAESVEISDIDSDAPVDVFAVDGENVITSLGLSVNRNTTDSSFTPSRGSRIELGIDRAGALGGDFDFTRLSGSYQKFWTVDEDFLGRKTIVTFRTNVGYILEDNEAPVFERFYAGGHRSFRGFGYRGVGPRGIRNDNNLLGDDPVGGDFMFLAGLEYGFPLVDRYIRGVLFTDQGTVDEDFSLTDWRVSVGGGLRITLPMLGQIPFAVDFAVPVIREDTDQERIVSFDIAIPFQ